MNRFTIITTVSAASLALSAFTNPAIASVSFYNPGDTNISFAENGFPATGNIVDGPLYDNQFEYLGTTGVHLQGDIIATLEQSLADYSANYGVAKIATDVVGDASVLFAWDFRVEVVGSPVFDVTIVSFSEDAPGKVMHDSLEMTYSGIGSDQTFSDSGILQTLDGNVMGMYVRIDFVSGGPGDSVHVILPSQPDGGFTLLSAPSPGAAALLGIGGLAVTRRRRA